MVVFGENPYAEFQGDLKVMTLPGSMTQHLEIMKKLQDEKIPVVAILMSGRPLWQNRELNLANAYVAAWLPGTEGGGISDVLFRKKDGAVNFDFTGKLSYSWPRDATGAPLNVGQDNYDPLFPLGFGMTYAAPAELAALSEDPGIPAELMSTGSYFDKGLPVQPWSLRVSNGTDTTRITTDAGRSHRRPRQGHRGGRPGAGRRAPLRVRRRRQGARCRSPAKAPWTCRARPTAT